MESMDPISLYLLNYFKQHLGQFTWKKLGSFVTLFMHLSYFEKHFCWLYGNICYNIFQIMLWEIRPIVCQMVAYGGLKTNES